MLKHSTGMGISSILHALHASQTQGFLPNGNPSIAELTRHLQYLPELKRSPALPTKVAPLHKLNSTLKALDHLDLGSQPQTPANQTRQHARLKAKAKP